MNEATVARFWKKVDKNGPTIRPELGPCWNWTAYRMPSGYGVFRLNGRNEVASRVSWMIASGSVLSPNLGPRITWVCICHHCDNPPCVRPSHLFVGSYADNVRDRVLKGRSNSSPGESNHQAKLSDRDVEELRARSAAGDLHHVIATDLGVTKTLVGIIAQGKAWKHLPHNTLPARNSVGEHNGAAKLTDDAVREIRAAPKMRGMAVVLAAKFGVHPEIVRFVLRGRTWKHVV